MSAMEGKGVSRRASSSKYDHAHSPRAHDPVAADGSSHERAARGDERRDRQAAAPAATAAATSWPRSSIALPTRMPPGCRCTNTRNAVTAMSTPETDHVARRFILDASAVVAVGLSPRRQPRQRLPPVSPDMPVRYVPTDYELELWIRS